jgi:N-acetylmuramic acid 6-phosphate (MurNAc-6-P) etherase
MTVVQAEFAENDGLKHALVSIDAIAANAKSAQAIADAGANYLPAVKANQSTLRAETEIAFNAAEPSGVESCIDASEFPDTRKMGHWTVGIVPFSCPPKSAL